MGAQTDVGRSITEVMPAPSTDPRLQRASRPGYRQCLLTALTWLWALAIAVGSAASGHTGLQLLVLAVPVVLGAGLASWAPAPHRVRSIALGIALVAAAAATGLVTEDVRAALLSSVVTLTIIAALNIRSDAYTRRKLVDANERWQQLLAIDELVVGLDITGTVTMINDLGSELLTEAAATLMGQDWLELTVPADQLDDARTRYAALIASGARAPRFVEFEQPIIAPRGPRLFRWRATVTERADGTVTGSLASGIDITEQRAAEQLLRRDQEDLTKLVDIVRAVARQADARQAVVEGIEELSNGGIAALCELTPEGDALVITASTLADVVGDSFPLLGAPSGVTTAFSSAKPFFVSEAEGHPLIQQRLVRSTGARSVLYEPIFTAGKPSGELVVGWTERVDRLGCRETNLVALAAGEASSAIDRATSLRALQDAAMTDALTGVANRRSFDLQLEDAISASAREELPVAVAMMDLNAFKSLNDTEGHDAGDRILKECAARWLGELRPQDAISRFGGDEFAVILPSCGTDAASSVAERLRATILLAHTPGAGVGIAVWDGHEDADALLKRADRALYADKAAQRRLDDPRRLQAVRATGWLDQPGDSALQDLTDTLADELGMPIALMSVITGDEQIYGTHTGLPDEIAAVGRIGLEGSYCRYPASTGRELIVDDASRDDLLREHPATKDGMRAYAGIPIKSGDITVGVVCAASDQPCHWSDEQLAALRLAARHAERRLEQKAADRKAA